MMRWLPASNPLPLERQAEKGMVILIPGIEWLPPKWQLPILWRLLYPWAIARVDKAPEERVRPYFVTTNGDFAMKGMWRITTRYVALRVGSGATRFLFKREDGSLARVRWYQGRLYAKREVRRLLDLKGEAVTFI